MIKMSVHLFNRKVCFITKLAHDFFIIISFLILATITIISFFLRYLLKPVAGKMKTCIAGITIKDLIWIIIEAAETYLAVSLKELFIIRITALGWPDKLLVFDKVLQHLHGFIRMAMLKIFENCYPHQILLCFGDLRFWIWNVFNLLLDWFH